MDCDGRNLNYCARWDCKPRNGGLSLGFISLVWRVESGLGIAVTYNCNTSRDWLEW